MIDIRKYYGPIQPSVKVTVGGVTYLEFLPDTLLQPYIYCYWQLSLTKPLSEAFIYRVVADGCIDIFFDCENSHDSYVMGFCNKVVEFPLEGKFRYFGVRFFPTIFSQLFGIDAKKLSNTTTPLSDTVPDAATFISLHMDVGLDQKQISTLLDTYFLQILWGKEIDEDKRFYSALELILANNGVLDVDRGFDTGISPRQLRRHFEYYIGTTAKTFCKVVRFQCMLRETQAGKRPNHLFLSMGYYDQSHFIKEFRSFYGLTPGKALRG